ncbi:hydroxymethylbilane synthase [Parvibium lacunae]|uniref:Porphobilinogen deaminase n=1 Tax=Parvibium lacunae TaxID=1888893 RepID=A0A368L4F4_9BURK|nr:hydroxymethylbilane synthase [Parvibium lacunae]RCS58363.1 hydroxymethylbilane synthase [Parvibium lacunae]
MSFSTPLHALSSPVSDASQASPSRLIIATRESRLALWQAEHVRERLQRLYPDCQVELLGMTTRGDQILDRSLAKVGGKGLFIKELEVALAAGAADLAVHSLKDVPMQLEPDFSLAAILERADPRDALVSNDYASLAELPAGAIVGTSSMRRAAQISHQFPALRIEPLRGNLDTRLAKLDRGEYQAIVLAAAGLKRLGLAQRIRAILPTEQSLPAPAQGALGIECLRQRTDIQRWLAPLQDPQTTLCASAERALARLLGGSCQVPLAAYAQLLPQGQGSAKLILRGLVAAPTGQSIIQEQASVMLDTWPCLPDQAVWQAHLTAADALGQRVAAALLAGGAAPILEACLQADNTAQPSASSIP